MYRSLLVPLDGSTFGEHALPLALSIARRAGASLHLVHIYQVLAMSDINPPPFPADALDLHLKHRADAYLDSVVKRLTAVSPVAVTSSLLEGDIAPLIRATAVSQGASLVVMSTHARSPLGRFWLGSVADELVRDLPMPLLLVRPQEGAPDFRGDPVLQHVLLPLDGSPLAEQMLEPAVALGSLMDADYTLLRVVKPALPVHFSYQGANLEQMAQSVLDQIDKLQEQIGKESKDYLERVAERLRARSLRVQTRVEIEEQPAVAILKEATAPAIDLVALETHGRRGLSRLFLGSVADKVIRGTSLPVLVHRPVHA